MAVITLALGIGVNTAVFSVINAILLSHLPYAQPDRLVQIFESMRSSDNADLNMSFPTYLDLRRRTHSFQQMAALQQNTANLSGTGDPQQIACFSVTTNFWDVLGVSMAQGRAFLPEEARAGNSNVAVIDHGLWQRTFEGKPEIVGKTIQLDRRTFTVIGILPPDFRFYGPPDFRASMPSSRWLSRKPRPRPAIPADTAPSHG